MKTIISILMLAMLFSCSDNCCDDDNIDRILTLTVKDNQGNDLLAPQILGTYNTANITIFYLINDEKVSVQRYSGYLDYYPNNIYGYEIVEAGNTSGTYTMKIFLNNIYSEEDLYTTYIKWNDIDTDTIDCKIEKQEGSVYCSKVFYNGNNVWEISSGTAREIEIRK